MWWCTILECPVHAAKTILNISLRQASQFKRLHHQIGMLVADGARGELITVTDHIILIGFDGERILRLQSL